jgi:hypothetical protein
LPFLKKDCIALFGEEKGLNIYNDSSETLTKLLESADFRGSKPVEKHMRINILPGIAFYKAMQENGIEKEKAYQVFHDEIQKSVEKANGAFRILKMIPGFIAVFKWRAKKMMASDASKDLWDMVRKRDDKEELSFDIHRCVYVEILTQYGCPELCKAHCDADITSMRGLEPQVIFTRTQTIGYGAKYCDFRYLIGKKIKAQ